MVKRKEIKKVIKKAMEKVIRKRVVFSLTASGVKNVSLAGTFNNWNLEKHKMKKNNDGLWTKTVIIPLGNYEYKYIVDGEWWHDPENEKAVLNEHGTFNSVITIN